MLFWEKGKQPRKKQKNLAKVSGHYITGAHILLRPTSRIMSSTSLSITLAELNYPFLIDLFLLKYDAKIRIKYIYQVYLKLPNWICMFSRNKACFKLNQQNKVILYNNNKTIKAFLILLYVVSLSSGYACVEQCLHVENSLYMWGVGVYMLIKGSVFCVFVFTYLVRDVCGVFVFTYLVWDVCVWGVCVYIFSTGYVFGVFVFTYLLRDVCMGCLCLHQVRKKTIWF